VVLLFFNVFASTQAVVFDTEAPPVSEDNRANLERYVECLKNCATGIPEYNQVPCSECGFLFSNGTA
ncbi:unnamed protein product, partial [Cylicocyclus nassatus]